MASEDFLSKKKKMKKRSFSALHSLCRQAHKSGAITRKFRARFMSVGLSPPVKISRWRWLSSRGYKKSFPSARALIRRGEEEVMDIIASMRNSALAAGHDEISFISARVSH